jgi:hypothetical protein
MLEDIKKYIDAQFEALEARLEKKVEIWLLEQAAQMATNTANALKQQP